MVRWCIRLTRLTLVCEVIRYRLVQVRQNQKKRLFGLAARNRLSLSLPLSYSPLSYFLSFSIQKCCPCHVLFLVPSIRTVTALFWFLEALLFVVIHLSYVHQRSLLALSGCFSVRCLFCSFSLFPFFAVWNVVCLIWCESHAVLNCCMWSSGN